jgi:hypothetical protein
VRGRKEWQQCQGVAYAVLSKLSGGEKHAGKIVNKRYKGFFRFTSRKNIN